jgi:hypothetical protein
MEVKDEIFEVEPHSRIPEFCLTGLIQHTYRNLIWGGGM